MYYNTGKERLYRYWFSSYTLSIRDTVICYWHRHIIDIGCYRILQFISCNSGRPYQIFWSTIWNPWIYRRYEILTDFGWCCFLGYKIPVILHPLIWFFPETNILEQWKYHNTSILVIYLYKVILQNNRYDSALS